MRVPKKYQKRVVSVEIAEGEHSEDCQKDAYELVLRDGWTVDGQGVFICDTQKEVLSLIKEAVTA